jgi:hypothetical protein
MKDRFKIETIAMLSDNLESFCPALKGHFMCPICLTVIPLTDKKRITKAHIFPEAAGGKLNTFLCDKCNGFFGSRQDKWFGEYLKLINRRDPDMLATDIKDGFFYIDGTKVNGRWEENEQGGLRFIIHIDRNPPNIIELMKRKFENRPPKLKVEFSLPILAKRRLVEVGLLTAGYLLWFRGLGYSWVLQKYLNPVREQIKRPEEDVLKTRFVAYCKGIRWRPWIGLITISGEIMLTMGIEDSQVFFPPADRPYLYSSLCQDFNGRIGKDLRPLQFSPKPYYGPKVAVFFDNRVIVAPDMMRSKSDYDLVIYFSSQDTKAQLLSTITRERFKELEHSPEAEKLKIDFVPVIDTRKFWK